MYKAELRAGRKRKAAEAAKNQKVKKGTSARVGVPRYPVRGDSMPLASQQAVQAASIQRTVAPASVSSLGQLPRYNSRFWTPSCEAVDAFTTSWASEVSWLVPPLHLICRSIQHAQACAARGTLVVPMWVSAPFRPIL